MCVKSKWVINNSDGIIKLGFIPKPSSEAVRNRMRAAKSLDTLAKMRLCLKFHLRYRVDFVDVEMLRQKADTAFTGAKVPCL